MRGKLAYSPALDGLRAIAVMAVVAYHAGAPVPAGFVGVDIFFVISGYLITRLLHEELQATQRIDFVDFYARRARRILPALLAVVIATLAASVAMLPPAEFRQTAQAAAAAFVFAANVFFAGAANGYFDPDTHGNPLLHLWSIGVEEQFYLAWPAVLLLARKRPALVLALIAAASLAAADLLLGLGIEQAAFFQAPPRAWELAAGGLIALNRLRLPAWVGPMGLLVALVACAVPFGHFPGTGALMAVLGAAMVVATVHAGHRIRLLEIRPLVAVGVISYSLYLWHWPVMVLGHAMPTSLQVVVSLAAAATSYRFIEQPFRRGWVKPARPTVTAAAALLVVFAGSTLVMARHVSVPEPTQQAGSLLSDLLPIYPMGCDDWYRSATVKPCAFGPDDAAHTAVIVGDSVTLQWFPAVRKIFGRPGWRLVVLTKSSCPMVAAPFHYERIGRRFTECETWRRGALDWIDAVKPDVVLTGPANDYGFTQEQWTGGTRIVLDRLARSAGRIIMIRSTPSLLPSGYNAYDKVLLWQQAAASHFPSVAVVDMNPFVCPHGDCGGKIGGITAFRDQRHISPQLAEALSGKLLDQLELRF